MVLQALPCAAEAESCNNKERLVLSGDSCSNIDRNIDINLPQRQLTGLHDAYAFQTHRYILRCLVVLQFLSFVYSAQHSKLLLLNSTQPAADTLTLPPPDLETPV